tara:strand:+ start:52 stop:303 length:252 start_codon:yes stop_codon:yes gene_type:complete
MAIEYHQNGFACSCGYQKLIHAEDKNKRLYNTYKRLHKKTGCSGKELDTGFLDYGRCRLNHTMKDKLTYVAQAKTLEQCVEIN